MITTGDDSITGTAGDDIIDALAGDDTIDGLDGNDTLDGNDGDDSIIGGAGADSLLGGAGLDFLDGGDGADILNGGADDDVLDGGVGNDTMTGGAGVDQFLISTLSLTGEVDTITDFQAGDSIAIGTTGGTNIDPGPNLISFIGTSAFSSSTNEVRYVPGDGVTIIETDVDGDGAADHTVVVENGAFDLRTTIPDGPTLEIDTAFGVTTAGDDLITGGTGATDDTLNGGDGNDNLRGMEGDDVVNGGAGDDFISGHTGDDTIDGGAGDDQYSRFYNAPANVAITDTTIVNSLTGESDSISNIETVSISNRLGAPSNDTLDGSAATLTVWLFGGAGDDVILGGSSDDIIEGDSGNDTMTGGLGADLFDFDFPQEIGVTTDVVTDLETVDTLDFATINTLGEEGDPDGLDLTFIGLGAFSNTAGEFRYSTGSGQTVVEFDIDGNGTADRFVTILNGAFELEETSFNSGSLRIVAGVATPGDDCLLGSNSADTLAGMAGDDKIEGFGGADELSGEDGNDSLFGGGGNDTLKGGGGDDSLEGGDGANTLDGADGDDTMNGGDGNDFSIGGAGNDIAKGAGGDDVLNGGDGSDLLNGGADNDAVKGAGGADALLGLDGDDTVDGGAGNDILFGGAGADEFDFRASEGADTITDFQVGVDQIDLSAFGTAFDTFAEIAAATTDIGADALIDFGGGNSLTLQGVNLTDLSASDFGL